MALATYDRTRYVAEFSISGCKMTKIARGNRSFSSLELHPSDSFLTAMSES